MANIFDTMKSNCFAVTAQTMGYDATWIDSQTEIEATARVHFKIPTPAEEFIGVQYEPIRPYMEFHLPNFAGLKEAVDSGKDEKVTIEGKGEFWVRQVLKRFDGNYMRAILTSVNDIVE